MLDSIFSPFMTEEDMYKLIDRQIDLAGGQAAFARNFGLSPQYVNDLVQRRRHPGGKVAEALGFEKVVYYVRKETYL